MNKELDNEIKVIVNGKERNIKLNEEVSLKKGEYLYKENNKWYIHKINFKTIPITKEDYEEEIEKLNNIIDKQDRDITTLTKDKIKLNNIIDELEKYLKKQMEYYKLDTDYYVEYKLTLDKLKELKEGK